MGRKTLTQSPRLITEKCMFFSGSCITEPVKGTSPLPSGFQLVGWLEFNVPFQHKHGYIRDEDFIGGGRKGQGEWVINPGDGSVIAVSASSGL